MHLHRGLLSVATALFATVLPAQDQQPPAAPGGAATTAGSAAEQACKNLIASLRDGQGAALWEFLPKSWQTDVNTTVRTMADKVDARLYEQAFVILQQAAEVLADKKQFVLNTPALKQLSPGAQKAQMEAGYDQLVQALRAIGGSELGKHSALQKFDGARFCKSGGSALLQQLMQATQADGSTGADMLAGMSVKTLAQNGNRVLLQFTVPGQKPSKEEYLQVEGKWVPVELVRKWPTVIKQAKMALAAMPAGGNQEDQAQMRMGLGMADSVLKQFAAAKTQAEFDAVFSGLQGLAGGQARAQRRR
ncbi:MAG: hypothetical protein IPK26_12430 [Planctomycetes bacterium]|nr:hypothetical protein [Planctomycetota bacterium]